MGIRAALLSFALLIVVFMAAGPIARPASADPLFENQNIASKTYYTLNTAEGTVTAKVEATVLNSLLKSIDTIYLVAMPNAQDIQVIRDGVALTTSTEAVDFAGTTVTMVTVTLDRPLLDKARDDFEMTYWVGTVGDSETTIEPGLIEAPFVSQGPGSFTLIDMPVAGEAYVDPGCLLANTQPAEVQDAGMQRFVCGEALVVAFSQENPDVLEDCARLDDRCRQQAETPHAAYAQSITDLSKQGIIEGDVAMASATLHLVVKHFNRDAAWAQTQFSLASRALPELEKVFGFSLPYDTLTLRQSNQIEWGGAAGLAFPTLGEMLITEGSGMDEEVTIHELAHQWAGHQLDTSWLWEGQAEWATTVVAPTLGVSLYDRGWQSFGYTDPIATWWNGSLITNPNYWYGKSEAFWFEYEKAIGGRTNMTAVLSLIDDYEERWPLDGRWFMDQGEKISGANLDELFLTWVFDRTTASPLIAERRAVYNELFLLNARVATLLGPAGTPTDIEENLQTWSFDSARTDVQDASRVIDRYEQAIALAAQAGLTNPTALADSWGSSSVNDSSQLVGDQLNAVNSIIDATANLEGEDLESPAYQNLVEAREAYENGSFVEATELASGSVANAVNSVAAARMIEKAKDRQAEFSPSLIEKVGLFWEDPAGDLEAAEAALAEGEGTKALELSTSAYETWGSAKSTGIFRLSFLMAINCLVFAGAWMLLKRIDMSRNKPITVTKTTKKPATKPAPDSPGSKTQA